MASIAAFPNLTVRVCRVHAYHPGPVVVLLLARRVGVTTHTYTQHSLVVDAGTRFAICLDFDLDSQPRTRTLRGDLFEVLIRLDGAAVLHDCLPVDQIVAWQGRVGFSSFTDGDTGLAYTPEFHEIGTAPNADRDALQVGRIDVVVTHRSFSRFSLQHNGSLSANTREQTAASHYIGYANPLPSPPDHSLYTGNRPIGETGQFTFYHGDEEALATLGPRLRSDIANAITNGNSNANANANVTHNRTSTANANANHTSTNNPANPSGSNTPHATPPTYPAYGHPLPHTTGQSAPLGFTGHVHREEPAPSNFERYANTRPASHSGVASASVPNGVAGLPRRWTRADFNAVVAERQEAAFAEAASARVPSGASIAPESQTATHPPVTNATPGVTGSQAAANRNTSRAQTAAGTGRGHGSSASNTRPQHPPPDNTNNSTSTQSTSFVKYVGGRLIYSGADPRPSAVGSDPLNDLVREMARTSRSNPTSNATESRPAAHQTTSQAQVPGVTGAGQGSSISNNQRQRLLSNNTPLNNTITPPTRSAPHANDQRQHLGPSFASRNLNSYGQSRSSGTTRSRRPPTPTFTSRRPAQLRPAGEAFYASRNADNPTDDQDDSDISSSEADERPTTARDTSTSMHSRRAPPPAPVDPNHAAFAAGVAAGVAAPGTTPGARVTAFAAAMTDGRDGNSSSSARPPTASQGHVIDLTREDADAGSSNDNDNTNTLAPQTGYRHAAAPPVGQPFMAAAIAAHEARNIAATAPRNAAIAPVYADGQGVSGSSGGSSSSSASSSSDSSSSSDVPTAAWNYPKGEDEDERPPKK